MSFDKVNTTSQNLENENLEKLRHIFPQFVKDGQIDFNALSSFFDKEGILADNEKYGLSWAGKSNAFKAIRLPSAGTLTPQKNESKNWDNTENIFIEGDNLEVLKLLQKHYREKIKMIYIDPPYNTGKDFVYKDNFTQSVADYYEQTGQSKNGIKMTANTEKNGRYHSDWLTMMYPRLFLARNLLKDDGVIFVSIDDNEVANLRLIMDEIFGEENFVTILKWNKTSTPPSLSKKIRHKYEFILCYEKQINNQEYIGGISEGGDMPLLNDGNSTGILNIPKEKITFNFNGKYSPGFYDRVELLNEIIIENGISNCDVVLKGPFKWVQDNTDNEIANGTTFIIKTEKFAIRYIRDGLRNKKPSDIISKNECNVGTNEDANKELQELFGENIMSFPKPFSLIKYLSGFVTSTDDIVLDFFAGSGTTAHAVMDLNSEDEGNRKWICVQLPEEVDEKSEAYKAGYKTISQIARERIRRAGEKINKGDIGFKAFSLSSSNYRKWNTLTAEDDENTLIKQSKLFIEKPLVDKYDEMSVVYEILLKEGFDLNSKTETNKGELKEYIVDNNGDKIVITFAKKVSKEDVEKFKLKASDTFVCFDSALDDTTKVNIGRNINLRVI